MQYVTRYALQSVVTGVRQALDVTNEWNKFGFIEVRYLRMPSNALLFSDDSR
jgi:hypothetical protein